MNQLVEYLLEDGSAIVLEVAQPRPEGGMKRVALGTEAVKRAEHTFEQAIGRLKPVGAAIIRTVRGMAESPDEVGVEFGVKMSAETGVVIAGGSAEANLKVSLTWKRPAANAE